MQSTVTAFPLSRQQKLVRGIADVLRCKRGDDATLFWRDAAKALMQNLIARGVDPQSAEDEVRGVFYAVMGEMEADAQVRKGRARKTPAPAGV
ncbi:hypothetical protein J2X35_003190 [Mesorhizobium sp. BE184]|nr:hypothetical protein [Mesorhizobium sp. BE184]